jgi:hypothetical protein
VATLAHGGLDQSVVHFAVSAKKDMLARLVQGSTAMRLPAVPAIRCFSSNLFPLIEMLIARRS